ncbi:MAG: hypothetical protein JWM95_3661, partial [Gemmatimonadetes bacterium]|nr:hypothetical protein [Gemmatimonadota bacterium]
MQMPRRVVVAVLTGLILAGPVASAQYRRNPACRTNWDAENYFVSPFFAGKPVYDGRVTFARIQYTGAYECGAEGPGWAH